MNREAQEEINSLIFRIQEAENNIRRIAKENIPDFFWLDHKVSTFWTCTLSPIGWCVWVRNSRGSFEMCRYCQNPVERK